MEFNDIHFGILLIGLVFFVVYFSHLYEKKRTKELELVANKFGFLFSKTSSDHAIKDFKNFELFSKGHSKTIKNKIWTQDKFRDVSIFEYSYTTGGGKNSSIHQQTVLTIKSNDLNAPNFKLKPEKITDKIVDFFGHHDIDFEMFLYFSKKYLLKGKDEENIKKFFTPNLIEFFEENEECCIEVENNVFVFYMNGKRYNPAKIEWFYDYGERVFKKLIGDL